MSDWLATSYMARKGVAKGKAGATHQLTEAKQGKYHYVYGPYADPVLRIKPGDIVVAETKDAFEGAITSVDDQPTELLHMPFLNPQCGPIAVEGAEKGDVLAVHIHSIKPRGPQPVGTSALIPEFGGLVGTGNTALLNDPLPEKVIKMEVTEQGIKFNSKITLPYEPFIGTLGVSPEIEAITSLQPDYYGGNMDLPDVAPGAIVYFPVHHKDAYLYPRRLPRHAGRRRAVRRRGRDRLDHDDPGRPDQGLEHRLAAARERARHHDHRQHAADGGRRPHRLPRADPLAGRGLWLGQARGLLLPDPGRPGAAGQHGRPEIHARRLGTEELPRLISDYETMSPWTQADIC